MSAFVVEPKTINRVVTYLQRGNVACYLRDEITEAGFDIDNNPQELAQAMMNLNVDAVNQRYAEHATPPVIAFVPLMHCNDFQVLKSLQCWLYQCNVGNVPESQLFQLMERASNQLAHTIINRLPAYDKADGWA